MVKEDMLSRRDMFIFLPKWMAAGTQDVVWMCVLPETDDEENNEGIA